MKMIYLYQIQYDENSKPNENSGFKAFDVRDRPEFLKRETAHMVRLYEEIISSGDDNDFYGLFSPKFTQKTGLFADDVIEFVNDNNVDVCLFNPLIQKKLLHVQISMFGTIARNFIKVQSG